VMVWGVAFDVNGCTNTELGAKKTQHFNRRFQAFHTSLSIAAENLFYCSHSGEYRVSITLICACGYKG
jgi:hypothetical protein